MYQCPCCDYFTLKRRGHDDICRACFWEDSGLDIDDPDEYSDANHMTLREARDNFASLGACEARFAGRVLRPEQRALIRHEPRALQMEAPDAWDSLSEEERAVMRALTPVEVGEIDTLLMDECSTDWRKVARVIGELLDPFEQRFPEVPFVFLSYRLQELEAAGVLEIEGDPFRPRYSEVRLTSPQSPEAPGSQRDE